MSSPNFVRYLNLLMTGFGAIVFALMLAYVNLANKDMNERVAELIVSKTSEQVAASLADRGIRLEEPSGAPLLQSFADNIQTKMDLLQHGLDAGLDRIVADVLAAECKLDCQRREEAAQAVHGYLQSSIARYGMASDRIEALVIGRYDAVVSELRTDLNIFAGSNAFLLAASFLLSLFKRGAARHLLPIASILTVSTILMSVWYLLGQNWVMTIVFGEYWGWSYPAMQAVLTAFLGDIALNRGRITTRIFNFILHSLGSSLHLPPC